MKQGVLVVTTVVYRQQNKAWEKWIFCFWLRVGLSVCNPLVYEWNLNGSFISDDEDPMGLCTGIYSLLITDAAGCILVITGILVENITATFEAAVEDSLWVYPNPASGLIFFSHAEIDSWDQAELIDVHGMMVRRELNNKMLSLKALAAGMYVLRLYKEDRVWIRRIVVE